MSSLWTARTDNRLLTEWGRGRSEREIARILGTNAGAVAARLKELRSFLARSDIEDWRRANVMRGMAARERTDRQRAKERKLIAAMAKAIAGGMPPGQAALRAYKSGVNWRIIGEHFGISGSAASAIARAWTRRKEIAQANQERAQARVERQRKLIADMARAVKRGMPSEQAMAQAHRAGASWVNIAAHFGISQQGAHYRAKTWTRRARPVRTYRPRRRRA